MIPAPDEASGFLRTSARVSVVTGLARVAGFSRYIVLGLAVGTTYLGNTYETANWVPNIVFELAAGGVLSAVFVPTFVRELENGRERGIEIASSLANTFLLLSVPVVVVGAIAAKPIMRIMTIAVSDPAIRAAQIETGSWFLYVFLPQVPIYVLAMVMTGILHAHRRFIAPAAAPLFSSLVVISAYLTFGALGAGAELGTVTNIQRYVLAGGTTAGVFVLAFSQLPSVISTGVRWRPVLGWGDPAVRRALRAGLAGAAYFAISEIGLIITLLFANRVQGGVVAYRVAFAFFDLPRALIGIPVAAVLLPTLAEHVARSEHDAFARMWSRGWKAAIALGAPAAAGLVALAPVLADAVLSRAPSAAAPELVGSTLRVLALGVPAFVLVEPLIRTFFARHETRAPVVMNAVTVGVSAAVIVPLSLIAAPHGARALQLIGLGTAAGHWLGVAAGTMLLATRVRGWAVADDLRAGIASVGRAALMGVVVYAAVRWIDAGAEAGALIGVVVGVGAYALLTARGGELRRTWKWLRASG
ncbi:MAG TPA: lipid II flippase MurJ [Actinomycetota bacterium]|jgi:putative peptidoglycan lipid II flippase|nr:lipid II flippase MurJ [Actinomycetota bacterium]